MEGRHADRAALRLRSRDRRPRHAARRAAVEETPRPPRTPDPDGDGVERELSVGDVTAMTIYTAAQETPGEVERLAAAGLVAAPTAADAARIAAGPRRVRVHRLRHLPHAGDAAREHGVRGAHAAWQRQLLRRDARRPRSRLRSGEAVQASICSPRPKRLASKRIPRVERSSVSTAISSAIAWAGASPIRPETPSRARPTPTP